MTWLHNKYVKLRNNTMIIIGSIFLMVENLTNELELPPSHILPSQMRDILLNVREDLLCPCQMRERIYK